MKICGLITEYDPFHNGHVHHIEEARKATGADYVIAVMSGNFVQRGTPAIIDKYSRTRMALYGGADLVLELPTLFATSGAEVFAFAAVSLLHQLGAVDYLCFGTEDGELESLERIAGVLYKEPASVGKIIRESVKTGMTYPAARALALETYFKDEIPGLSELLEKPNNILGIEYLKAIKTLNSDLKPVVIKRWKTDYHSDKLYEDVASATALRKIITTDDSPEGVIPFVPTETAKEISVHFHETTPIVADDFSEILQYALTEHQNELKDVLDFSPDLQERVKNLLPQIFSFEEWVDLLKTKAYTRTRISRALLHVILGIRKEDLNDYKDEDYCMYARVLGFKKDKAGVLTALKKHTALPIITKMADADTILNEKGLRLLNVDVRAADLYRSAVYFKYHTPIRDEFTMGIIKQEG